MDFPIALKIPFLGEIGSTKNKETSKTVREITLNQYKETVSHFKTQLKKAGKEIEFKPASEEDIKLLEELKIPQNIATFFAFLEPSEVIKLERVILYPIKDLYKKNTQSRMGKLLQKYNYRIVAGTTGEDVYCINLDNLDIKGQSPTYLITGNALNQDNINNIRESCYLVGTSFSSYLHGL